MHPQTKDMTGQRFGLWFVIGYADTVKRSARWLCRCDCGTEKVVSGDSLRLGRSTCCGCRWRAGIGEQGKRLFTKHGHTANYQTSPEYWIWAGMIARCTNEKHESFHNYGGRGITVCARWLNSFADFLADVGPRPDKSLTLDRIDNDGDYEPGNVRWATRKQQMENHPKRNRRHVVRHDHS